MRGSTLAASLALAGRYPASVFESLPLSVSSNSTQYRLLPSAALYPSAWPLPKYTLCAPLLAALLLIFLMVVYPSKSHNHDSKVCSCKRLHAIFTKAGLEPPLSPSSPAKGHPVFRIHITPAPPGLSRSKTGSVHARRHSHRSNKYRLPRPDFEKVMEDIWESPEEGLGWEPCV